MIINQNSNFGTHNTSIRKTAPEYIVVHYTGAIGTALANISYFNQPTVRSASADFFVGYDGEVWQYNPDPMARYCWAVGGGKQSSYGGRYYGVAKNTNCISIEMCVRSKTGRNAAANSAEWYLEDATLKTTVELTRYLMNLYGISADHVIRHYDVNGKKCPGIVGWNAASGTEASWNAFKSMIGTETDEKTEKLKWRVNIDYLRIRSGPGVAYAWTGKYTGKGVFTIVEKVDGWGRLKSGAGWICLDLAYGQPE